MARFTLSSGAHLAYEAHGAGQPLLLLHGWGVAGACFHGQTEALRRRFRVVVPDLRGHGASSILEDGEGVPALAADIAELMSALDLRNPVLVGWSLGAMVAWHVALGETGSRLAGLVSIDMVPKLLNDSDWQFGLREGRDAGVFADAMARMRDDWPAFTRVFVPRVFARGRDRAPDGWDRRLMDMAKDNHPASMARLWASLAECDLRGKLARIRVPSLVCFGARSRLYRPEASQWLANTLPRVRLLGFTDSGHAPQLEEPTKFNDEIAEFATSTVSAVDVKRGGIH